MDDEITATYCFCDDMLKTMHHYEDPQVKMSDLPVPWQTGAEVMITTLGGK